MTYITHNTGIMREKSGIHFSQRELQCIELTLLGKPAKQVGFILGISQRTVEEYIGNIKTKLSVLSKSAMIEKLHQIIHGSEAFKNFQNFS